MHQKRVCTHFGPNPDDTAGNLLLVQIIVIHRVHPVVYPRKVGMDLLQTPSRCKVYARGFVSLPTQDDSTRSIPGSSRCLQSMLTIICHPSSWSMSIANVEMGLSARETNGGWIGFFGLGFCRLAPGPGMSTQKTEGSVQSR